MAEGLESRARAVELFFALSDIESFSGGTVAIAAHPTDFSLAVSVLDLAKVLIVSTETGEVTSTLEVPEPFEDGPKSVAFDATGGSLVLVIDDCVTRWQQGPYWMEHGSRVKLAGDCECISVDACSRILLDCEPPCWLLPSGEFQVVPLEARPPEPPLADEGDTEALLAHQNWEATTTDLSTALVYACTDGSVCFYSRDSKSVHFLPVGRGENDLVELSVRRPRTSSGVVVHMESYLPEEGCCCVDGKSIYVAGPVGDDLSSGLAVWSFTFGKAPSVINLDGFRCCPAQLDSIAADGSGILYLCVVEEWPDRRAIYRVKM